MFLGGGWATYLTRYRCSFVAGTVKATVQTVTEQTVASIKASLAESQRTSDRLQALVKQLCAENQELRAKLQKASEQAKNEAGIREELTAALTSLQQAFMVANSDNPVFTPIDFSPVAPVSAAHSGAFEETDQYSRRDDSRLEGLAEVAASASLSPIEEEDSCAWVLGVIFRGSGLDKGNGVFIDVRCLCEDVLVKRRVDNKKAPKTNLAIERPADIFSFSLWTGKLPEKPELNNKLAVSQKTYTSCMNGTQVSMKELFHAIQLSWAGGSFHGPLLVSMRNDYNDDPKQWLAAANASLESWESAAAFFQKCLEDFSEGSVQSKRRRTDAD